MAGIKWRLAQYFELLWWKRYLDGRPKEEYLAWKTQYWHRLLPIIQESAGQAIQGEVLDAGCGPAGIFMVLDGCRVTAIDPLLDSYRTLQHFAVEDYPHVHFRAIPLEELIENARYDWICCMNAINHVADMELCLHNLAKALKPGGTLVLSIDAHNHGFLKALFRLIPGDILHPHQHSLSDYERLVSATGLVHTGSTLLKQEGIFSYWLTVFRKPVQNS